MSKQLKTLPLYGEDNHNYLADDIIKLYGLKTTEVLLLKTSGYFDSNYKSKIAFDYHKSLFGVLAMLKKKYAGKFPMANVETFKKCKVFFVHGTGKIQNSFDHIFCPVTYFI